MKTLPLILLGLGGLYFLKENSNKNLKSIVNKTVDESKKEQSKLIIREGYTIKDCKLTVSNKDKALDYAFKVGVNIYDENSNVNTTTPKFMELLRSRLFGDCLKSDTSLKSLMNTADNIAFVFDMIKYGYSGLASRNLTEDVYIAALTDLTKIFEQKLGYLPSVKIELVKQL